MDDAQAVRDSMSRPEAFAHLFDQHFEWLFGFCSRRVGARPAEDVVGEVFRRAFEKRDQFDVSRPSARPWLIAIALNVMRNETRRQSRERVAIARVPVVKPRAQEFLDSIVATSLDAKGLVEQVRRGLAGLPEDEYQALTLFAWDELSYGDIADAVGVPVGTIRSRIHRARQRLQASLSGTMSEEPGPIASDSEVTDGQRA
jgi:RNA polymerase sigma-70 factor (ECF subfamily)